MSSVSRAGLDNALNPVSFASHAVRAWGAGIMATTEHTINDALAAVLRETRRAWSASSVVSSENTGMLKGSSRRPDILIIEANVSPVVIETEVLPAVTVESEAVSVLVNRCEPQDDRSFRPSLCACR